MGKEGNFEERNLRLSFSTVSDFVLSLRVCIYLSNHLLIPLIQ